MDDLVKRLRETADTVATTNHSAWFLYTQAADCIEALEAENETLRYFRASFAPGVAEKLFGSHGE